MVSVGELLRKNLFRFFILITRLFKNFDVLFHSFSVDLGNTTMFRFLFRDFGHHYGAGIYKAAVFIDVTIGYRRG